jgi:hypothetical protein
VAVLELLHDRDDGEGLGFVALVAADLEREASPVDEQSDHDLRVDAAFLGVADLPQSACALVFLGCFEVERGDVVEHQADVAVGEGVVEAGGRDLVAIGACVCAAQGAFAGRETRRYPAHLCQDPVDVEQAGRLDHACDHQVTEDLVVHDVEAEAGVHPGQRVVEQPGVGLEHTWSRHQLPRRQCGSGAGEQTRPCRGRDHRGLRDDWGDPEVENPLLVIGQQSVCFLDEQPQLGLVTRGTDVANDPTPTRHRLSDLHRGRPRAVRTLRTQATGRSYRPELVP